MRDSHFRCKIANKCLNVWREMKVVTSLPLLLYKLSVSVKGILDRKKIAENSDFAENSNFIRGNREAGFPVC